MTDLDRTSRVMRAMVRMADTLVDDYDVLDLLQGLADESTELLESTAAGILLAGREGVLEVAASSDDGANVVEVLQLAADSGPCVDAYRTGEVVSVDDITSGDTWPEFQAAALAQGFRSVHAVPLRLRKTTVGSLNLFRDEPGELSAPDQEIAQAFADMAAIGILQSRALVDAQALGAQLQQALDSRIVIEQAKGFVAYRRNVSLGEAFTLIRGWSREHRMSLSDTARDIIERRLEL